jgi:glutaconate CoA-transferase, subunit A
LSVILDEVSLSFYPLGLVKPYHSAMEASPFFITTEQAVGRTVERSDADILRLVSRAVLVSGRLGGLRVRMTRILGLDELAQQVRSGAQIGVGGVHLARLPIALIASVLALGRGDFTYVSWGGGLPLELFLQADAVKKLIFCFSSLDILGLAPQFREALETHRIEVEEWSALAMIQALHAAFFNLPEMPFQLPLGSDLMSVGNFWKQTVSSFTGEPVGVARRLDIDVLLIHAQRADREGNVEIQGARGLDVSLLGAAKTKLFTVEEIVEVGKLGDAPKSYVLPHNFVTAVACVPMGAYPTSCLPYYSTDYRRLINFVREEADSKKSQPAEPTSASHQTAVTDKVAKPRFICAERRAMFLRRAARVPVRALTPERLANYGLAIEAGTPYTMDEFLAVALAREYDNSSICSVGSVSPLAMVSYLLAKRLHAPGLTLISLNGGFVDVESHPMSLTLAEPLDWQTAKVFWGGDETYHWYYQTGRITHEVITVAQVDVHGRTNNAWIESKGKHLRLPGQGGMADVANLHKNFVLYLTRHSPERFVDAVSFCTASRGLLTDEARVRAGLQPGKVRLISNLGTFDLDFASERFRLVSIHPGITLEQVRRQTGGEFLVADPLPSTPTPSLEQLRLIRREIDPFGIRQLEFVPSKARLATIERILDAEEAMLEEVFQSAE